MSGSSGTYLLDASGQTDRKRGSCNNAVIAAGWLQRCWKPCFFLGRSEIGGIDGSVLFLSLLLGVKEAQYRRAD
jgi:hypothetical protein